ncbi:MAG: spore coat protein CotJB [Bacillota bacterium]
MHREQQGLLNRIQALEFTAVDFNLYLDTHPNDQRALCEYQNTVGELEKLRREYVQMAGPLTPMDLSEQSCWRWIEEPWPWQIEY